MLMTARFEMANNDTRVINHLSRFQKVAFPLSRGYAYADTRGLVDELAHRVMESSIFGHQAPR